MDWRKRILDDLNIAQIERPVSVCSRYPVQNPATAATFRAKFMEEMSTSIVGTQRALPRSKTAKRSRPLAPPAWLYM